MSNNLVIYHGNCVDGFGAAYAARVAMPDAEFHAGIYGQPPPDVTDKYVFMLDFSYKKPVILEMAKLAKSIIVIDHHLSAQRDLDFTREEQDRNGIRVHFDMNQSGAVLAWKYFNPDKTMPHLFSYIQDRDLWRNELPNTHEVSAALFSYEYNFFVWDGLVQVPIKSLAAQGCHILRKQKKDLEELLPQTKRHMFIGGHTIYAANLPYQFSSEAGHLLSEGMPFGATYYDTQDGRVFSLRSREEGLDVSQVAVQYGGGGHKHAAGFKVPRSHPLAIQ